jgi:predicted secreted protein
VKRHVDFLAWLHIAWGIVFLLVALAGGALAAGALAISMGTSPVQPASPMAARLTAFTLLVVSVLALLWGALHLWIGRALGAYRPWARLLALGLAVVNLVLLPFGTALGAYACWVLLKDEGRRVFVE